MPSIQHDADVQLSAREIEARQGLETFGHPWDFHGWDQQDPDYVAALELTEADVPQLMAVAREWIERTSWPEDPDDVSAYAPVHAWRALGQLGAVEATGLLLEMMAPMEQTSPDWYLEDFPQVFEMIGPQAIDALAAYLVDQDGGDFPRATAAHGLERIATRYPAERERVVEILRAQMARFMQELPLFNALLISHLLDLNAVEAAEPIERAFAAVMVDVSCCGNWSEARVALGVKGMGIVPPELVSVRRSLLRPRDSWADERRTEEASRTGSRASQGRKSQPYKSRKRRSR